MRIIEDAIAKWRSRSASEAMRKSLPQAGERWRSRVLFNTRLMYTI
ncbi:MAG: hypothetical protein QNJ54_37710 [Prochloraceae cyanobacterium]|nr:hypothetical protein [Prochloraceae cyanobacterium]